MKKNPEMGPAEVAKYFKFLRISRQTIYNIYNRLSRGDSLERKKGQGRKLKSGAVSNTTLNRKMKKWTLKKGITSYATVGKKFGMTVKTAKKMLMSSEVNKRPRKKIPHANEKQKKKQRRVLHELSRNEFRASNDHYDIIMDDEKYFDRNQASFGGNKYYFSSPDYETSPSKKYREHQKFPSKVLLWIAISRKGLSKPYFRLQKEGAIKSEIYVKECIKKRLVKFIKGHY